MKSKEHRLSKSQYVKGRKCHKRVWLYNNRKDIMTLPSAFQAGIFEQGHEVGRFAHRLFPSGVLIEHDHKDPDGAVAATQEHLKNGVSAIFEAAFIYDNILVRADIIARNGNGTWNLFEVKSTTSVKKDHLLDTAIQKHVLEGAGLPLHRTHVVHLNNRYIRRNEVDLAQLFVVQEVDDRLEEALGEIPDYLKSIRATLTLTQEPKEKIGSICKNPYECEFKTYCWTGVGPDSIHFLSRISDTKRGELLDRTIEKIKDIPEDFALTELQAIQTRVERTGKPHIEHAKIKKFLNELKYPLWFLDFETYGFAIPEYDGTRSYEALPFQYSLHVQQETGSHLQHFEFLHLEKSDPRRAIAEDLIEKIKSGGSVVTYHASFERGRLEALAELFPDLKAALESIASRIFDLETPFAKKWYCDGRFQGSSSIKKVLPALVPSMSYANLDIGKGDEAQSQYCDMIKMDEADPRRDPIRQALLEYCKQDTLAMVQILEALKRI
jgi:hypothetical protein